MNCTRIRVVISASMTSPSERKLQTIDTAPNDEQGDVGKRLRRMQPAKRLEEVAVLRRRVGDARVTEQQRKHRPECRPQDRSREKRRDRSAHKSSP